MTNFEYLRLSGQYAQFIADQCILYCNDIYDKYHIEHSELRNFAGDIVAWLAEECQIPDMLYKIELEDCNDNPIFGLHVVKMKRTDDIMRHIGTSVFCTEKDALNKVAGIVQERLRNAD